MNAAARTVCHTTLVIVVAWSNLTGWSVAQESKPKLILDADTANEIDDMYAIVRMFNQDRFDVLALSSAQWFHYLAEPDSVGASQKINEELAKLLHLDGVPTVKGSSEPMGKPWGGQEPKDSPAARFIMDAARKASPDEKLTVMCLGASTNLASAIAMDTSIAKNIDAYILGCKYDWATGVWNKADFNTRRDLNAADYLLNCEDLALHIMPVTVAGDLKFSRDSTFAKHRELGELGAYLTAKWKARFAEFENWVMWDLALVQAAILPELATSEEVTTPPENVQRKVTVYRTIDATAMRENYWKVVMKNLRTSSTR
ncbi:MAG: hypothetical protein Aurels2KO_55360 [Aureliella sp.]